MVVLALLEQQIGVIFVQICAGRETMAQLPSNQRNFVPWGFDEHLPSEVKTGHVGTSNGSF